MFPPIFFQQTVEVQIYPVALEILGLASLDAFKLHPQFLHQTDGLHGIDFFGKYFVSFQITKGIVDHSLAGLIGITLPPVIDAVKSVGLMQKLGMQLEGIQRSQTKDLHGNWADLYFYGLLEDDWRKQ